jgi:hypothetical protein
LNKIGPTRATDKNVGPPLFLVCLFVCLLVVRNKRKLNFEITVLGPLDSANFCPQNGLEIINLVYWIHHIGLRFFCVTEVTQLPKRCDEIQTKKQKQT